MLHLISNKWCYWCYLGRWESPNIVNQMELGKNVNHYTCYCSYFFLFRRGCQLINWTFNLDQETFAYTLLKDCGHMWARPPLNVVWVIRSSIAGVNTGWKNLLTDNDEQNDVLDILTLSANIYICREFRIRVWEDCNQFSLAVGTLIFMATVLLVDWLFGLHSPLNV